MTGAGGGAEHGLDLVRVLLAAAAVGGSEGLSDASGTPCVDVAASAWRVALLAGRDAGAHLDWLAGVDVGSATVEVVAMLVAGDGSAALVRTSVPHDGELPSVADALPSAAWHERETAEMLGITFTGGDPRHLLLPEGFEGHPLRRDFPLAARLSTTWPGAAEAGRRARTPGVNPEWGTP